ncbi:MAG: hypothetical protein ILA17_12070 [Ruminococcus sp.]|nr:hypothetical protein [Ruminococcus sp.]
MGISKMFEDNLKLFEERIYYKQEDWIKHNDTYNSKPEYAIKENDVPKPIEMGR